MASIILAMGVRTLIFGTAEGDLGTAELHPQVVQLIALSSVIAFFSWFWLRGGQTLGMQAWRIKLVGIDGQPPGIRQAMLRCLGAVVSAACFGLGYWWCIFDSRGRYWHDHLSGTDLVLVKKREKKV